MDKPHKKLEVWEQSMELDKYMTNIDKMVTGLIKFQKKQSPNT